MVSGLNRCALLVVAVGCGFHGCGGRSGATDAGSGGTGSGGRASGGAISADAAASGDSGSGGFATGGSAGATATGGAGSGDARTGGAGSGGATATGGAGSGGARTGGAGSGGARTGGAGSGDARTGGAGSGGARTGGAGSWGARTGGAGSGGTPAGALLDLDHTGMDFGSIPPGTTARETFTLTNRGASASGPPSFAAEGAIYPLGMSNPVTVTGCAAALPAGASCVLTVSVTPAELGLLQVFVRITADPGIERRLSIYVQGNAIGFEVSPPSRIALGDLAPGVSVKHSFTVTALVALADLTLRTSGGDLTVDAVASTCAGVLAKGASCEVVVVFNAATVGWKRDVVAIKAGGDMGQVVSIELTANVTKASELAIEPKSPPAYACVFERTSPPVLFTVTNQSSTASAAITSAIVGGDFARDFAISATTCATLAPQASCTISVVCQPGMSASAATRQAILSVTDGNTHLAVPLSGEVSF